MLVLYALVRLAQERRPRWLVAAAGAFSLALHAHPATIGLAPIIAIVALSACPSFGWLLRWGAVGDAGRTDAVRAAHRRSRSPRLHRS